MYLPAPMRVTRIPIRCSTAVLYTASLASVRASSTSMLDVYFQQARVFPKLKIFLFRADIFLDFSFWPVCSDASSRIENSTAVGRNWY